MRSGWCIDLIPHLAFARANLIPSVVQSDAAVFRTASTLKEGKTKMEDIVESYRDIGVSQPLFSHSIFLGFRISHQG